MQLYPQDFARHQEMDGLFDTLKKGVKSVGKVAKKVYKPAIVGVSAIFGGSAGAAAAQGAIQTIKDARNAGQGAIPPPASAPPPPSSIFEPGSEWFPGVPNGAVIAGGAAAVLLLLLSKK